MPLTSPDNTTSPDVRHLDGTGDTSDTVASLVTRVAQTATTDANDTLQAAATLGLLIHNHPSASAATRATGAIPSLLQLVDTRTGPAQRTALATLLLLVHENPTAGTAVVDAGGFRVLVRSLATPSSVSTTRLALLIVATLVHNNHTHQLMALAAGIVRSLLKLVRDGYEHERHDARVTLARLVEYNAVAATAVDAEASSVDIVESLWNRVQHDGDEATALAQSVLTQFLAYQGATTDDPTDALASVVTRLHDTTHDDHWSVLLALEELLALVTHDASLAALAVVETTVIPLCVTRLGSTVDTECLYASHVVAKLVRQQPTLGAAVLDAVTIDELVAMLHRGNRAVANVLLALVEGNVDSERCVVAVASGAIPPLVHLLRVGRWREQLVAVGVLDYLVKANPAAQTEAVYAGAMDLLVKLLDTTTSVVLSDVVVAVKNLVQRHTAAKDAFVYAGGARSMVRVLVDGAGLAKTLAAQAIGAVVSDHSLAQAACTAAGAVEVLIRQLESETGDEAAAAASALALLADDHAANRAAIVDGPALGRLVHFLQHGTSKETYFATYAIHHLTKGDDATTAQAAMAEAHALAPLVRILTTRQEQGPAHSDVVFMAALALLSLVSNNPANQVLALHANAVAPLLTMLQSEVPNHKYTAAVTLGALLHAIGAASDGLDDATIASLVEMLRHGDDTLRVQTLFAISMHAQSVASVQRLADRLPLDLLLEFLHAPHRDVRCVAMGLVCTFTELDKPARARAIEAGIVGVVVNLLQESTTESDETGTLLFVLASLLCDDPAAEQAAVNAGAVDVVRTFLDASEFEDKPLAAAALALLSSVRSDAMAWGVVPPLLELLQSADADSQFLAAAALACLTHDHAANQAALVGTHTIARLVELLDVSTTANRHATLALGHLVQEHAVLQGEAVHAGARAHLTELIRNGSIDATTRAHATRTLWSLEDWTAATHADVGDRTRR